MEGKRGRNEHVIIKWVPKKVATVDVVTETVLDTHVTYVHSP